MVTFYLEGKVHPIVNPETKDDLIDEKWRSLWQGGYSS